MPYIEDGYVIEGDEAWLPEEWQEEMKRRAAYARGRPSRSKRITAPRPRQREAPVQVASRPSGPDYRRFGGTLVDVSRTPELAAYLDEVLHRAQADGFRRLT